MRVEFIELLRCPEAHEPSALVTVAHSRDGERLIDGTLGCAMCGAEFPLRRGVVYLAASAPESSKIAPDPTRAAALLGLAEPGMRVALCGAFGAVAGAIEQETGVVCLTVNAPSLVQNEAGPDHVVIGSVAQIPLAGASLSGIALDAAHVPLVGDAARVVRVGGRVLAPIVAAVPAGLRELARDAFEWIAVVETSVSTPVGLRRGAAALP